MSNSLIVEFEDQIAELRGRLPRLAGHSRRDAAEKLQSLTEFLDLLAMLRDPGACDGDGAPRAERMAQADAITSAKPLRQEA